MLSGLSVLQLPSWPVAPDVSTLEILSVTLLIPLAIAAVITVLVMGPGWQSKQ
jgi:hypothetical protein